MYRYWHQNQHITSLKILVSEVSIKSGISTPLVCSRSPDSYCGQLGVIDHTCDITVLRMVIHHKTCQTVLYMW